MIRHIGARTRVDQSPGVGSFSFGRRQLCATGLFAALLISWRKGQGLPILAQGSKPCIVAHLHIDLVGRIHIGGGEGAVDLGRRIVVAGVGNGNRRVKGIGLGCKGLRIPVLRSIGRDGKFVFVVFVVSHIRRRTRIDQRPGAVLVLGDDKRTYISARIGRDIRSVIVSRRGFSFGTRRAIASRCIGCRLILSSGSRFIVGAFRRNDFVPCGCGIGSCRLGRKGEGRLIVAQFALKDRVVHLEVHGIGRVHVLCCQRESNIAFRVFH